ncbi:MFS transporter [Streptomyces sp. MUM 203J]|uniref:MFS transporter n=1 Tax=Streptomyces sp. MUM 203J TaxID=2791990 RepID=UPI001F04C8E6|nr:MFS transporter [Streptomyces sp. MUM 203J]MCH0540840.1 MFS transporter [Streptomyces sp. MUM 203J]
MSTPPPRPAPGGGAPRLLAVAQFGNSVGDGAFYTCSALYFSQVVGLSAEQIGLGLTVAWGVGSLAGVPLGQLADRRGPRGTAVPLALATAATVAAFLFIRAFVPFLVAACLYATAQCGLAAARQALLAGLVEPSARTGVLARLQATLNAGLAVGAGLGGLALHAGTREAYLAVFALDALCFVSCALVLRRLPRVAGTGRAVRGEPRLAVLRDRPYALVTLLNAVLLLRMPLLSLALPLWIAQRTAAPDWTVSALFVLNTLTVTLFQVRVARAVTGIGTAARAVRRSGAVMLASCAVFATTAAGGLPGWAALAVLLLGAALQVVAEMQHSAGAWQIGFSLAPPDRIGQYQGFFGSGVPVARTLGPVVATTLLITWGPVGWLLLGALLLGASAAMGPAARHADRVSRTGRRTAAPRRDSWRPGGPASCTRGSAPHDAHPGGSAG